MKISDKEHIAKTKWGNVRKRNPRKKRWTSSDGSWLIRESTVGYGKGLAIENLKTGFGDNPIRYSSGKIAYEHPERIPLYVKKQFKKMSG